MINLEALVRTVAKEQGIDEALLCAVVEQESAWNPWAIRYEPAFERRYCPGRPHDATSWGLGQVMGLTARELGYGGKYISQLCDPREGLIACCRKLHQCLRSANGDRRAALLRYNGGSRPAYADEVMARVEKYERPLANPAVTLE